MVGKGRKSANSGSAFQLQPFCLYFLHIGLLNIILSKDLIKDKVLTTFLNNSKHLNNTYKPGTILHDVCVHVCMYKNMNLILKTTL